VVVLAAAGYIAATRLHQTSTAAARAAASISTTTVSVGDIRDTLRVTGTLAAEKSVTLLAPRVQGSRGDFNRGGGGGGGGLDFNLVLLHLAKPGTMVKAGDIVGEFDTQNQLQRLDDYKDTVVQSEASIRKMTADLEAGKEAREQAVRSAKAAWDQALLDIKTAPVRSEIDAEKNRLSAEEDELTYKEQLKEIPAYEASQEAALRSAQFNLGQARLELQRAENNIARMTIRAPIDGMVVLANIVLNNETRQVREGDQIFAGQPFVSIVDPRSMIIKATVNQVDGERLRLGMKADVSLDAYPDFHSTATLEGIGAMSVTSTFRANYVGEIPVRLKIAGVDPRLIPDLTGSAEIILAREPNATKVPRDAVFADADGSFVYLRTPEGWKKQKVDLGLSGFTDVAIHSGVSQGDTVALGRVE
jgi:multidrug efflux pump subunit AcrA (membrane-fusion protein)